MHHAKDDLHDIAPPFLRSEGQSPIENIISIKVNFTAINIDTQPASL